MVDHRDTMAAHQVDLTVVEDVDVVGDVGVVEDVETTSVRWVIKKKKIPE